MSVVRAAVLKRRVEGHATWGARYFALLNDGRLEYGANAESPKQAFSLTGAHVSSHVHSNQATSFTLHELKDSDGNSHTIQLIGASNAETEAWRSACAWVISSVKSSVSSAHTAAPTSTRWDQLNAAVQKAAPRGAPSRSTLDIRLDKAIVGESIGVPTAWDLFERPYNELLDQSVNNPCWQLVGLDNGIRRFRHESHANRFKAVCAIDAPPTFVLHALLDSEQRSQWDMLCTDLKSVERIDPFTDIAFTTLRPFVHSSALTLRFWAPRELLTLRTWSRDVPLSDDSDRACVLLEVGIALKDRDCKSGNQRIPVNFIGYLIRASPFNANQSIVTCIYDFHVGGAAARFGIASRPAQSANLATVLSSCMGISAANEALQSGFAMRLAGLRDACAQITNFASLVAPPKEELSRMSTNKR